MLAEIVYNFYSTGRPSATNRTYSKKDILQYARMGYGNMLRQLAFSSQKNPEWKEDYFYADILSTKSFKLEDPVRNGMRRVDMAGFNLYRLPKSIHIASIYPKSDTCGKSYVGQITLVNVGEENFYLGPDFSSYQFGVIKGRGIDTYHVPPCVKELFIESTFDSDDVEVPEDICFDIANQILGAVLRIPGFAGSNVDNSFSPPKSNQLRRAIVNPQEQQTEI